MTTEVALVGCDLTVENDRLKRTIEDQKVTIQSQKIKIQDLQTKLEKITADRDSLLAKTREDLEKASLAPGHPTQCSLDCPSPPTLRSPHPDSETVMLCPVPPPRSPFRQQRENSIAVEPSHIPSAESPTINTEASSSLPNQNASLSKDLEEDEASSLKRPLRSTRSRNSISGPTRRKETSEKRRPIYHLEVAARSNSQELENDEANRRQRTKHLLRRVSSQPQLLFTAPGPPPQEPPLTSGLSVKVVGSYNATNQKGKAVAAFIISVRRNDQERWRIEKMYSDFWNLDNKLKAQPRSVGGKIGKLPNKALFTTNAPSKVDQRKMAIEKYLQHVIQLPGADNNTLLRDFLNSDRVDLEARRARLPGHKDGYLTKRGKNFGGWKSRYFVLDGPVLKYYESRDGPFLGSIYIPDTQIGPQHPGSPAQDGTNSDGNHYRHAFMILEPKKSAPNMVHRHVLCADSDGERDEWLEALSQYVCDTVFRKDCRFKPRKVSKDDIKPIAAMPMAQLDTKLAHISNMTYYPQRSNSDTSLQPFDYPFFDSIHHEERFLRQRSSMDQSYLRHNHHHSGPPGRASLSHASSDSLSYPTSPLLKDNDDEMEDPKKTKKVNRRTFWAKKIFTSSTTTDPTSTYATHSFRNFLSRSSSDVSDPARAKQAAATSSSPTAQESSAQSQKQVFGVPLEKAIQVSKISDKHELPSIVWRCIEYLEAKNATQEEGIYRLSGSAVKIRALKQEFNEKGDVDLLGSGEYYDVHAIAGLLKMWLRELPSNVLTSDLLKEFLPVIDLIDRQERVNELGRLVSMLPFANYTLLRTLTAHLIRVVQNSETNKMTVRNMGIVFSPTLGIPAGIFSLFLSEFDYIFWTNDQAVTNTAEEPVYQGLEPSSGGLSPPPEDMESLHPTQPAPLVGRRRVHHIISDGRSNRNSVHYMDGAPPSIVNLEKGLEVSNVVMDDEDEVNDLELSDGEEEEEEEEEEPGSDEGTVYSEPTTMSPLTPPLPTIRIS
ncbi:hypothetical protein EC973_004415 [Apophysomyces ossiformis]|uniref:RhoGAP-domain-containing protein n=1 Tax=Apophysomyces ossiformis TaxID=679940 RepID=A0A8H7BWV5_9FUNG|nr:hypothetical protein EC973_004415 [Apophysomyces ossiformis]